MNIYQSLVKAKQEGKKKFAVLIDPDKVRLGKFDEILHKAKEANVDFFFIGGSLVVNDMLDDVILKIKEITNIPTVLFPGSSLQLSYKADAILFLSLISGRNPDLLIGKHVETAPFLKISPLEIISTGYMLVDGGRTTTVQYISNTTPIPSDKSGIALCTAMAGEMLGLKLIYMDAGSGANNPVPADMIEAVSGAVKIPVIVGGGISTKEEVLADLKAGADVIVVGNSIESNPQLIEDFSNLIHLFNK